MTNLTKMHAVALAASVLVLLPASGLARQAPTAWPHETSDIKPDPAVRFGVLENGMRFAIMRNVTPPGQVSLRLRIGAGSLQESEAQLGLAHFLEHLAFRGSTHVPEGELQKSLERIGLRMGADTNASTSQSQTVYRFDLPNNRDESIDTGLMLLREIASELTIAPEFADKERGVVLSEERLRDTPGARSREQQAFFLLKDQYAITRLPIGNVDTIRNAPVSEIVAYYRAFYRPERATIIVAGDIDPESLATKISQRFGDWRGVGMAGTDPDLGMPLPRQSEQKLFVEAGAPRFVSVSWVTPYKDEPDTMAQQRHDRVDAIAFAIVNQRMQRVAAGTDPPFMSAGVGRGAMWRSAKVTTLSVNYDAKKWSEALQAAVRLQRQVVADGVTQAEIDREVTAMLTRSEAAVRRSGTRATPGLAGGLLNAVDSDEVYTSPAMDHATAAAQLKTISVDEIEAALADAFVGNGPLLFLSSPDPIENGEAALLASYNEAQTGTFATADAEPAMPWPYTDFGMPGAVVEQRDIETLGVTMVRFANGARLTIKPTKFRDDQVLVTVRFGKGRLVYPNDRVTLDWAASRAFLQGGLEKIDFVDIRRALLGKIYSVGFGAGEDSFSLAGNTRAADLVTQMQLLAAYMTAPGWRPEAFIHAKNAFIGQLAQLDSTPAAVYGAHAGELMHAGDKRWALPSEQEVRAATPDDLKNFLTPYLAEGPLEIIVVGDVTNEAAIDAVAGTFAALPPRREHTGPEYRDVKFAAPASVPITLNHNGRADQAIAVIAWPTTDSFRDPRADNDREVLNEIIRQRLTERLRATDGATYSPRAGNAGSMVFENYGYLLQYAEVPPDKTGLFYDSIKTIVADLRENGPGQDELDRVKNPMVSGLERDLQSNGAWLAALTRPPETEERVAYLRDLVQDMAKVSPASVRATARQYLLDDTAWNLTILPNVSAANSGAPGPAVGGPN